MAQSFLLYSDLQYVSIIPLRLDRGKTTLTTVRLMADVVLGSSAQPGVSGVTFGRHFAVGDSQGHLVSSVHGSVRATPPQQNVGAAVDQ